MSPARERSWHYVRPNETTKVPRRHIFLDTESIFDRTATGHEQRWGIAVACLHVCRPGRTPSDTWAVFDDPEILWSTIDSWTGRSGRTVLWCHNLGYDLRIAEVFSILPRHGWTLAAHNMATRGAWLIWRKGAASLCMVDSGAVFTKRLQDIAGAFGMGKLDLPPTSAGGVGLYSRCWQDVAILRTAILSYLDWIEMADLGNWRLTGASQSWAAFRHRFLPKGLLVHADEEALAAERRAMWAGRCEAYWHGTLDYEVIHEWDFSLAYARIAQQESVPTRLLGPMPEGYVHGGRMVSDKTALLADVTIDTPVPVAPTHHAGRIVWPVGRFQTTLWDVEILEAQRAGATVTIHRGWLYRKGPVLRDWATWVIDQLEDRPHETPVWLKMILKHWSRALIGYMARSFTTWEDWGAGLADEIRAHDMYDFDTGETHSVVQIGRTVWREDQVDDSPESLPMITGYIQAICRVRYWRLLSTAPEGSVLYGDTDSVLVPDGYHDAMAAIAAAHPEWGLRLKRSWQGFTIWGPRQIRTGPVVRVSGVPRTATRTGRLEFAGQVWESLHGSLTWGRADRVSVRDRAWRISGQDHRRVGHGIGWTTPIVVGLESP